jgi:hypothetical protein
MYRLSSKSDGKLAVQETVRKLCYGHKNVDRGLAVLNIGFGLGIVGFAALVPELRCHLYYPS